MKGDLHIHTLNSDGKHSIQEIALILNKSNEKRLVSIVDHHYLTIDKFNHQGNMIWLPGIEISALINGNISCHLVGYSVKPLISRLLQTILNNNINGYQARAENILSNLKQHGYDIKEKLLQSNLISRPIYTYDIANALGKLLNIQSESQVVTWARLNGNLLFVKEKQFLPDVKVVIEALKDSNFIVSWAHPGTRFLKNDDEKLYKISLKILIEAGINAIEVFYPAHSPEQIRQFLMDTAKYNLLVTGGSDFHGEGRGVNSPQFNLNEPYISDLMQKLKSFQQ